VVSSTPRPQFTPGKEPVPIVQEAGWAPEPVWTGGKSRPYIYIYRVSQEEYARLRESVPYVKVYRFNPKHLYPKLKGYGDNGQRKVGASCGSKYCNLHS